MNLRKFLYYKRKKQISPFGAEFYLLFIWEKQMMIRNKDHFFRPNINIPITNYNIRSHVYCSGLHCIWPSSWCWIRYSRWSMSRFFCRDDSEWVVKRLKTQIFLHSFSICWNSRRLNRRKIVLLRSSVWFRKNFKIY